MIAIDLETACTVGGCKHFGRSLCDEGHSLSPWHSKITVIAVSCSDGTERVFRGGDMLPRLKEFLDGRPTEGVVGQNLKFDLLHLAVRGLHIPLERFVGDSQLAAYVLTEKISPIWLERYDEERKQRGPHHRKAGQHSLKTLAPYFLGVEKFWEAADHDDDDYVTKDARYSLQLIDKLERHLKERGQYDFYKNKQLEWTKLLMRAEARGIRLDTYGLLKMQEELKDKAVHLERELDAQWSKQHQEWHKIQLQLVDEKYAAQKETRTRQARWDAAKANAETKVDYNSPKQMAWLLRDALGYDITSLEEKESTGREVLERLANQGHEDVRKFLEWRKVNKILTAFIPTYLELQKDGVLHPIYNPDSTRTGRTSSERPNIQQSPPQLKTLLKPRPGYTFVGFDQAAIEARLIALYTGDPTLINLVQNNISIHDHSAKAFFNLPEPHNEIKTKYPNERAAAKRCTFSLFYGAGAKRIKIAFTQAGFHLTLDQCYELHRRFKQAYSTAFEAIGEYTRFFESGQVMNNLLGRPIRIAVPQDAHLKGFNSLIQSSASDLLLEGALRADAKLKEAGIEAHPIAFIHDFFAAEVEEARAEEAQAIIEKSLTEFNLNSPHGRIPLEVDGGVMRSLGK